MERFPVFRSRDSEETRAFLDEKQFRFDMAPRQRPALGAQLNGVYLPSMYLGYIEYGGAAVATTATSGRSDYWIQIALRGNIEVAAGRDVIACDAAHAALTSPNREPTVRSGPGSARFHVSLTEAALVRQLTMLLGEPAPRHSHLTRKSRSRTDTAAASSTRCTLRLRILNATARCWRTR